LFRQYFPGTFRIVKDRWYPFWHSALMELRKIFLFRLCEKITKCDFQLLIKRKEYITVGKTHYHKPLPLIKKSIDRLISVRLTLRTWQNSLMSGICYISTWFLPSLKKTSSRRRVLFLIIKYKSSLKKVNRHWYFY
jgi:hypothetical protein